MEQNELYPIFLKLHELEVLIVGGGFVGLEKLSFMLKSSPKAKVTLASITISDEIKSLAKKHTVELLENVSYKSSLLKGKHIVIAATNDKLVNGQIYREAKTNCLLVNVADNPPLCDFYLGGIVTKGNLKVAISTNGKSPTTAKRLRQFFEDILPNDLNTLLDNLNTYRKQLKGDFEYKVNTLNKLTESFINRNL